MRSVLSVRWLVSVVATVVVALIGVMALSSPFRRTSEAGVVDHRPAVPPSLTLLRAVDRTVATQGARVRGTATSDDGVVVELEGSTSFTGPDAVLLARPNDRPEADPIEIRTTAEGTWIRTPSSGTWTSLGPSAGANQGNGNWSDTLALLRRATDVRRSGRGTGISFTASMAGRPAAVTLDRKGRIQSIRLPRGHDTVEVTFSDFGVPVEVLPPDDL